MANMPSTKSAANRFEPAAAEKAALSEKPSPSKAVATKEPFFDPDAEDAPAELSTEVQYVRALVTMKPGTSVVVDVPFWEIEVLGAIHGPESVQVQQRHYLDYPYNAAKALVYLKNKYKTKEQEDVISDLYPRLKDFARETGLPYEVGDEGVVRNQQSQVIINEPLRTKPRATKQGAAGSGASGSDGE